MVPAGVWVPEELAPPIVAVGSLADAIDPATGEIASLTSSKHPIDAEVENRMRVVAFRAPAYDRVGLDLSGIPKNLGGQNEQTIQMAIRGNMAPMVERGAIAILRILTGTTMDQLGPGTSDMNAAVLVYRNRKTGREERARLPR
jgi:hypothetical protein